MDNKSKDVDTALSYFNKLGYKMKIYFDNDYNKNDNMILEKNAKDSSWKKCFNEIPSESIEVEFIVKKNNEGKIQYVQHIGYYYSKSETFASYDDSKRYFPITKCLSNDKESYVELWIHLERKIPPRYIKTV